jgi:hypothetical protein
MKNCLIVVFLSFSIAFTTTSCKDESIMPTSDLPSSITTFISTHFSSQTIIQSIKDYNETPFSFDYEVLLSDFVTLEFNKKGEITKIESRTEIPTAAIPSAKVVQKAKELFSDAVIIGWEIDDRKQEIKLSNKVTLEFNKAGDFLRNDD